MVLSPAGRAEVEAGTAKQVPPAAQPLAAQPQPEAQPQTAAAAAPQPLAAAAVPAAAAVVPPAALPPAAAVQPAVPVPAIPQGNTFYQLTNGSTPEVWIQLGTPRKWLYTIFDTGSDRLVAKTWATIKAELSQIDQGVDDMVTPSGAIYNHMVSKSFMAAKTFNKMTQKYEQNLSRISYGSGQAVVMEGTDAIQIGDLDHASFVLNNFSIAEIVAHSLSLLHTKKRISGVLGMQHMYNRSLGSSLFSRLRDANMLSSFGYCRRANNTGTVIWGDNSLGGDPANVIGEMHWAVPVGMFQVKGSKPQADPAKRSSNQMTVLEEDARSTKSPRLMRKKNSLPKMMADGANNQDPSDTDETENAAEEMPPEILKAKMAAAQEALHQLQKYESGEEIPCQDSKCVGILDSGSNIIAAPSPVIEFLSRRIGLKKDCSNYDSLPPISFGAKEYTIQKEGYVMKVPLPEGGMPWMGDDGEGGGDAERARARARGSDAGLIEEETSQESLTYSTWRSVLEDFRDKHGIDLTMHLGPPPTPATLANPAGDSKTGSGASSSAQKFMCMPALVSIDKPTQHGPLFIIGTPFLETNYARWSHPPGAGRPQIFIQPLDQCKACKDAEASLAATMSATPVAATASAAPPVSGEVVKPRQTVMPLPQTPGARPPPVLVQTAAASAGPPIRHLDDLRFPHWALKLETV